MISSNARGFTKYASILAGGDRASKFEVSINKVNDTSKSELDITGALLGPVIGSSTKKNLENFSHLAKSVTFPATETQVKEYFYKGRKIPLPAIYDYSHEVDITFYNDGKLDLRMLFENYFMAQKVSKGFQITLRSLTSDYNDGMLGALKGAASGVMDAFNFSDKMHLLDEGYSLKLSNCYIKNISGVEKNIESLNTITETTVSFIFSGVVTKEAPEKGILG